MEEEKVAPPSLPSLKAAEAMEEDMLTQLDHLAEAESYIKTLRARIDKQKQRKELASATTKAAVKDNLGMPGVTATATKPGPAGLPVVEVWHQHTNLEVAVIVGSGLDKERLIFHKVIAVLEEEGAEVVNAGFSIVSDKIYHTFHSQVRGHQHMQKESKH
uniref:Uncharacterized protein n=1 Tax=Ananas comosus var. bracteatus TaxID=296719 RepID=A0A6V7PKQ7_ANACO|nr:unnamed protein product [Ananas comosus var. bracteatus]